MEPPTPAAVPGNSQGAAAIVVKTFHAGNAGAAALPSGSTGAGFDVALLGT